MINKFSEEIKEEIEALLKKIQIWEDLFNIKLEFYFDGWALFLKEKNLYPRCIVIFKSTDRSQYSIKSYNIYLQNFKKEEYEEIYSVEYLKNHEDVLKELKAIIYGKDLGNQALKVYYDTFTE
jgi:hypothetical protein